MKKFIASTLVVLLLAQSLTPATYASISTDPAAVSKLSAGKRVNAADDAAGINTSKTDYGYGTTTESAVTRTETPATKQTKFIDTYKNSDLGKLTALEVTQVAIV